MRDDAVLRRALPLGRGLGRTRCVLTPSGKYVIFWQGNVRSMAAAKHGIKEICTLLRDNYAVMHPCRKLQAMPLLSGKWTWVFRVKVQCLDHWGMAPPNTLEMLTKYKNIKLHKWTSDMKVKHYSQIFIYKLILSITVITLSRLYPSLFGKVLQ